MSAITWQPNTFTGTPDDEDRRGAHYVIRVENKRRAALDPPEPPLPSSTALELRTSLLTVEQQTVEGWWANIIKQAIQDDAGATQDDWQEIRASIRSRLDNGESIAAIKADVAS